MQNADQQFMYYTEILNNCLNFSVFCFILSNGIFVHKNGTPVWGLRRKNVEVNDSDAWSVFKQLDCQNSIACEWTSGLQLVGTRAKSHSRFIFNTVFSVILALQLTWTTSPTESAPY
jgi:hypothetical protein